MTFRFLFFGYGDSSLDFSSIDDGDLRAFFGRLFLSLSVSSEYLELLSASDE